MSERNLVFRGKSKDVFHIAEGPHKDKYKLVFTDRATGYMEDGKPVFDPGYDSVVGEIPGKGAIACRFATYFFKLLKEKGIPSHYIDTIGENEMIVEPAEPLSMPVASPEFPGSAPLENLEFTWRNNATGSFWRRYPFVKPCKNLHTLVEAWTKGDVDILITMEALKETGGMSKEEIDYTVELVKNVAGIVSQEFASNGLHVIDGKFELGRLKYGDRKIVIIDEISPDVAALRQPGWPIEYGLGIMRFKLPRIYTPFRPVPAVIDHTGASGSWSFYCRELDLYLGGTVDQLTAASVPYRLIPGLLRLVGEVIE